MTILSGGNVGIGTTSPTETLQANGNIRALQTSNSGIAQLIADASNTSAYRVGLATFGNTATDNLLGIGRAANSFLYKIGGTLVLGTENAFPLIFSTTDTERMRITSGGLVGINTTSPATDSALTVIGNLSLGNRNVLNTSRYIGLDGSWGANAAQIGFHVDASYNSYLTFNTLLSGVSGGERMRITSEGNVGIGTTDTQTFRLAVDGPNVGQGDASTTIRVFDTTSATTGTGGGISFAGYFSGTSSIINTFSYIKGGKENSTAGDYASYLSFGTRVNGGSATERMRITSGGNVGIGTSSFPAFTGAQQMTMKGGASTTNSVFQVQSYDAGTSLTVYSGANSSDDPALIYQKNLRFGSATDTALGGYTERMRITSGGRVGIQNTSPQGILEVGVVDANSTYGGHFFSTFTIPVDTWSVVFYAPSNDQWNAITEFTWTSAADFNRSGAAYMRWAYEPGAAALGVVYTLFNNSQNSTASFRKSGNEIQVYITGGAANYYVQVRIQGSKAS
jgi:hypothetical protein